MMVLQDFHVTTEKLLTQSNVMIMLFIVPVPMIEFHLHYKVQEMSLSSIRSVVNSWKTMLTGEKFKTNSQQILMGSKQSIKMVLMLKENHKHLHSKWKTLNSRTNMESRKRRKVGSPSSILCGGEWLQIKLCVSLESTWHLQHQFVDLNAVVLIVCC